MKTYIIALERSKERYNYIQKHAEALGLDYQIIPAVDGKKLTREDLEVCADINEVDRLQDWLTYGAIGCALSHKLAYEELLSTTDETAFIIEDDVELPKNIKAITNEISKEIQPNEIILLYYTSFSATSFSSVGSSKLNNDFGLYYPMDIKQPITAAAYMVGRKAAEGLLSSNTPVVVTADCWHEFYSNNAFNSFRVLYPSPVTTKNFKSSIDYLGNNKFKIFISDLINDYKIPIAYQYLQHKRQVRLNKRLNHFSITDAISPIYEKLKADIKK